MSSNSPFSDPAEPGGGIDFAHLVGSLLMVEVLSFEEHVPTVHTNPGERSPAIRANITVLDGPQGGTIYDDSLIFPKVMVGQLRARVGKLVLGRLGQGEQQAGKNAPWKLFPANDSDRALGERALQALTANGSGPTTLGQAPSQQAPSGQVPNGQAPSNQAAQQPLPAAQGWGGGPASGGSMAPPTSQPQQPAGQPADPSWGQGAPANAEPPF